MPIWGFKLFEPLVFISKPKPVVPIEVLSQIMTLDPIIELLNKLKSSPAVIDILE